MKPHFLLAMAMLPLAACSGNKSAANSANGAAPAAEAPVSAPAGMAGAADLSIQPGQWEMRTTLENIEMPGAPPAVLEQMKQTVAAQVQQICFTPEDVANMGRRMVEQNSEGTNCTFSNQTFGGGRIDVAGTCQGQGTTVEMTMAGSYTPTSMETRNQVNTTSQGQTIRMTVTSNGRRTGECTAGAATVPKS